MSTVKFSHGHTLLIAVIVTLLFMIGIFTSDIYVPALPLMAQQLQATQIQMELSVGLYFLSFSLSQLIYGPLSDHFGRKPIIMLGLGIALLGSLMCMFAPSGAILIIGRIVQGIGMGAPMPLGRVVLRDLFTGVELARWNSYTGAFLLLAPAVAPILGGYFTYVWDWPSIFVFLIIFICVIGVTTGLFLPETRARVTLPLVFELFEIFRHYQHILKNKIFLAYALVAAIALGGMVAYLTLSPFLFQLTLGFTIIEYSWMSVFVSAALILGMLINAWLLQHFNFNKLIIFGLIVKCIAGTILLVALCCDALNAVNLMISVMLFSLGCSLVFANASSGAFSAFNQRLGMVGGLYGATQMFVSGVIGTAVSFSQLYADWLLALCFLCLGVVGLVGFLALLGKNAYTSNF